MECPTCGKSLTTERGVKQHHTKVHDDPLPNRECAGCGTEFYDPKARLTYCDDCNPNAGEHNGNWKDAKETTECERCGDEFEYYPSDKKGVYCPTCVEEADEFLGTTFAETVDAERITRSCDYCEDEITVLQCNRNYGAGRFCSRDCLSDWMSENRRGERHHRWDGGDEGYFGRWCSVRRAALKRDQYRCQHCGATAGGLGQNPDVHHITPMRKFDDPQGSHTLDNLIALCRSCHNDAESDRIDVSLPSRDSDQE
ncbi:HNH endonuclease [Halorientalis pallida]|uniref:HNH endonuclease n=1 Tax=Halorientalis pallida TaxID=2479928 RepID=A0A498KWJ4_9EURY|nr:HNH endonuclease signature motif containing protein [Halorientalis pallida]RXK46259.1 HNH endonuclease [Halorientalis pallida]